MFSLLLAIIYLAFISLGLPDSLLGSAWPVIHKEFSVDISYMGIVTIIISGCTIISSLFSDKLNRKFKTSIITGVSILLTAIALFGFSISSNFLMLVLFAFPYGLGAGAIDASLNNYVALHYKSSHMSWLHCFWGVGTIISPNIMSYCLGTSKGWKMGYRYVAIIQLVIAIIVFSTLFLWKKNTKSNNNEDVEPATLTFKEKLKIKGLFLIIFGFFGYCAAESTLMNWTSTYLVKGRGIDEVSAAAYGSLFFIGITIGRFISGFISNKLGDKRLIRIGATIAITSILLIFIPNIYVTITCLVITGIGCGPIYPSIIHSTPTNFGKENSQAIIGLQMAAAYTGSTLMPPVFGLMANYVNIKLFPLFLIVFLCLMVIMVELLNRYVKKKNAKNMI